MSTGNPPQAPACLSVQTQNTKKHDAPEECLASLRADDKKPEDLIGQSGPLKKLTEPLVSIDLDWIKPPDAYLPP